MSIFSKKKEKQSKEWLQNTIIEIDKLIPEEKLTSDVRYSLSFNNDSDDMYQAVRKFSRENEPTFQELLMKHIEEKGISNKEFYKKAHMDRRLFSSIKNNKSYQPSKSTALACCLALELSIGQAEELLKSAGYSLSLSITEDRVVYYCLDNGITDIEVVSDL